ncbi:hypothetical protein CDAR_553681 [Caerostris darwini]|uniref:Uncharacterized protein n=1 Tax=Caerostris darwini TaxID=1538125 RepID=A0AAV4V9Z4_9ARAC|nr:hypothetical protein CDAR_553681 [Caerostris darwini]
MRSFRESPLLSDLSRNQCIASSHCILEFRPMAITCEVLVLPEMILGTDPEFHAMIWFIRGELWSTKFPMG